MRKICFILLIACFLNSFGKVEDKGIVQNEKMEKTNNIEDTIWTEGTIIKVLFKNKKDVASKTAFEYRFKTDKKEYFIKYCEGKIKKDDLIPYVDKRLKVQGEFKTGLFDVCPEDNQQHVQSRVGDYVAIIALKNGK